MARKKQTLERVNAPEGSAFLGMSKQELLLDGSAGARDELYRREFNKLVKKQA